MYEVKIARRLLAVLPNRGPGMMPGQTVWDVWWTKWHCDSFSYSSSVLSREYHSTNATNSYSLRLPQTLCNINPELDNNI